MGDLSDNKGSSESEEMSIKTPERSSSDGNQARTCADCGTTKTPLWRGGPAGPKSLCNACGIRSRKRRRALLGLNKQSTEEKKSKKANSNMMIKSGNSSSSSSSGTSRSNSNSNKLGETIKRKLKALGDEVVLQRSTVDKLISRKLLGEEERAAILLMALSCGSVYA